jgi:thioredoxin-related protein
MSTTTYSRILRGGSLPILSALFILATASWCNGDSHDEGVQWKSYSEALRDAKTSHRKIVIDVYTTWCGWCKKMDRDVYADSAVARILSTRFELAKLNAESTTTHDIDGVSYDEKAIAKGYGVTGYPTTIFLNEAGEAITSIPGYIPKATFLDVLNYIGSESYKSTSWKDYQKTKSGQ